MKRFFQIAFILIYFVLVLNVGSFVHADIYVTIQYHSDGYYNYGNIVPEEKKENRYWFGKNKAAYLTSTGRIILMDKRFYIVNRAAKTYVELTPPLNFNKAIDKRLIKYFNTDQSGGTVQSGKKTKQIKGMQCNGYDINFWVEDQGSRFEEQVETRWMTNQVPFDLNLYYQLNTLRLDLRRKLLHWQETYVTGLKAIEGFPILSEIKIYIKGKARNAGYKVVDMVDRKPGGIFMIPKGYKRNKEISMAEWSIIDEGM